MEKLEETQVCTSVEQSERLLKLGLNKETADMVYITDNNVEKKYRYHRIKVGCYIPAVDDGLCYIPAWSLHRLVEMIPLVIWHTEYENGPRLKHTFWFCKHAPSYNSVENIDFRAHPNLYDNIIDCIEWLINEGYFNKDYLEERK